MRRLYFFPMITFFILAASSLNAETMEANAIIDKMKKALHGNSISEKVTIIIKDREQRTGQMVAGRAQKTFPDGNRSVLVLLEPEGLKGLAFLFHERNDQTIDQWLYAPHSGRVRKFIGFNVYECFLHTDFTYADLTFEDQKCAHKLLGEEDLDGIKTYKIETITQKPNCCYSRIINWIAKDTFLPLRRDYYDLNNTLWKRQLFENVTTINTIPLPLKIRMLDLKRKSSTEFHISEVDFNIEIPDKIFVPEQLKYSLECPIWQKVCYPAKK
jgi:hypothetical protein